MSKAEASAPDITDDAFLGGRLRVLQPRKGYRAGVDAVLLAAAVPDGGGNILDVGAGVGTVGLCVAARLAGAGIVLLEREPEMVALAAENIARNGLGERVRVASLDVAAASEAALGSAGLSAGGFEHVLANPPFHDEAGGTLAATGLKARAHAMAGAGLERWVRFMARMAGPSGQATMIHKAEALPEVLAAFEGRFGGLTVTPIQPREDAAAIRVLVQGRKASRAPLRLLPPFVLHLADGAFTPAATAILRHGAGLYGGPNFP
jgi:tRNA1(Val) A37 N6-methylase TrmN6